MTHPELPNGAPSAIRRFCSDRLGCDDIFFVKVGAKPDADPANYVANIEREVISGGGRAVFGWRILTCAVWIAAEFYAVHETASGLVDVTPNARGEDHVLFAPDHDVPTDFDYLDRFLTHRFSTCVPATCQEQIDAKIIAMDPGLLALEQRRAVMNGLTLEDSIALKFGPDKLGFAINRLIRCLEEVESATMAVTDGLAGLEVEQFEFLHRRKAALEAFVENEVLHDPRLMRLTR